jgi:hypothetical protein
VGTDHQRICRWCGLDADLAPTIMPSGFENTLQHDGNTVKVACLAAMLAEIKRLAERVAVLETESGGEPVAALEKPLTPEQVAQPREPHEVPHAA